MVLTVRRSQKDSGSVDSDEKNSSPEVNERIEKKKYASLFSRQLSEISILSLISLVKSTESTANFLI